MHQVDLYACITCNEKKKLKIIRKSLAMESAKVIGFGHPIVPTLCTQKCQIQTYRNYNEFRTWLWGSQTSYNSGEEIREHCYSHQDVSLVTCLPAHQESSNRCLRCVHGLTSDYMCALIQSAPLSKLGLRSESKEAMLRVPFTRHKRFGDCSFSVIGPKLCNTLPDRIKPIRNLGVVEYPCLCLYSRYCHGAGVCHPPVR